MYVIETDPIMLKVERLREPLGTIARERLDEIAKDVRALQHELSCVTLQYTEAINEVRKLRADIERHVAIAADLATEVEQMRAERDAARADALALAVERNNWQSMYHDAETERDAARELLREMKQRKDAAYEERNRVVAALAAAHPSGIARTAIEGWSDDWHGCVYIDMPTGQASWHYHDSQAHLFAHLPPYTDRWDGHTTDEKYARLAALAGEKK